jgi:hypothetical protein
MLAALARCTLPSHCTRDTPSRVDHLSNTTASGGTNRVGGGRLWRVARVNMSSGPGVYLFSTHFALQRWPLLGAASRVRTNACREVCTAGRGWSVDCPTWLRLSISGSQVSFSDHDWTSAKVHGAGTFDLTLTATTSMCG